MNIEGLRNEIRLEAAGSTNFEVEAFASVYAKHFKDAELIYDINIEALTCKGPHGKKLEILGNAEDATDETLTLVVCKYFGHDATLTLTDARDTFSRATGFVESSLDGWLERNLEISSREYEYAEYLRGRVEKNLVSKFKVLLLTDGIMSERIRTFDTDTVAGLKVVYEIWDQKRILEADSPAIGSEDIRIDFKRWLPGGLPCLDAMTSSDDTRTLLAVIPAHILVDVFEEYGSLLLESNVRTFLSARGAVNKGIQATLAQEPARFLAYNNGLTTTATAVEVDSTSAGKAILSIDRWQIVNGGQTTASIAHFLRMDKSRTVDDVYVQMKLVIVNKRDSSDVVQSVAKYANSQNKVSKPDLFATHDFHIRLEQISRQVRAPVAEGVQYRTGWYYERARGQWENDQLSRGSKGNRRKFEMEFPKSQKIVKTDWAKYAYCWAQRPHVVSKGAETVFADFAVYVDKQWEQDATVFNEGYFRTGVAQLIIYEDLRNLVKQSQWYMESKGYLANILAYAISRFALAIHEQWQGRELNFTDIWQRQTISESTRSCLLQLALMARAHLTDPTRPEANVTQWAKHPACWDGFAKVAVALPSSLEADLIASSLAAGERFSDSRQRKAESARSEVKRIRNVSAEVWAAVRTKSSQVGVSPNEQELVRRFGGTGRVPTDKQARAILLMLERFGDEGILKQGSF